MLQLRSRRGARALELALERAYTAILLLLLPLPQAPLPLRPLLAALADDVGGQVGVLVGLRAGGRPMRWLDVGLLKRRRRGGAWQGGPRGDV